MNANPIFVAKRNYARVVETFFGKEKMQSH